MQIGDWVRAYRPGIWQVHRILKVRHELRYSLREPRQTSTRVTVFVRRLLDAKWRASFTCETCELNFIKPLSTDERTRLNELLKDPKLRDSFRTFAFKPVDLVVNIGLGIPNRQALAHFCSSTLTPSMANGLSMDGVLEAMASAGLDQFVSQYPITATLQLVCPDHEMRNDEFVFRSCTVLDF